jgi:hypothetical protein
MSTQFPLPPIQDEALMKFCQKHDLFEAVAAGYHYAQKFFPTAKKIELDFHPPYRDDEPEEASITFIVKTCMTVQEVLDARHRFNKATNDVPGAFYICISHRYIK